MGVKNRINIQHLPKLINLLMILIRKVNLQIYIMKYSKNKENII